MKNKWFILLTTSILLFLFIADIFVFKTNVQATVSWQLQKYFNGSNPSFVGFGLFAILGSLINNWAKWGKGEYDFKAKIVSVTTFVIAICLIVDMLAFFIDTRYCSSELLSHSGIVRSSIAGLVCGVLAHHWIAVGGSKNN